MSATIAWLFESLAMAAIAEWLAPVPSGTWRIEAVVRGERVMLVWSQP